MTNAAQQKPDALLFIGEMRRLFSNGWILLSLDKESAKLTGQSQWANQSPFSLETLRTFEGEKGKRKC